jgi:hypothetical protein
LRAISIDLQVLLSHELIVPLDALFPARENWWMDVLSTEKRKNAHWTVGYFQRSARLKKLIVSRQ